VIEMDGSVANGDARDDTSCALAIQVRGLQRLQAQRQRTASVRYAHAISQLGTIDVLIRFRRRKRV
jgi:hypothetical protein